jgi:hypothetical protein
MKDTKMKKRPAPPATAGDKEGNGKKAKLNSGKASPKSSSHAPASHKPKSLVEALGKNKKANAKKTFTAGGGGGKQGKPGYQGKEGKDGKHKSHDGPKAPIDHKSLKPNFTLVRGLYFFAGGEESLMPLCLTFTFATLLIFPRWKV